MVDQLQIQLHLHQIAYEKMEQAKIHNMQLQQIQRERSTPSVECRKQKESNL
jgi:hypothetical protein